MKPLPISLYFVCEWWDRYYHAASRPRPERASQTALEQMYLGRQRFMFEQFGQFGIGKETPVLDAGQIATVIIYGIDPLPKLLGTRLDYDDAWGFFPHFRSLEEVADLEPVDVANTAEAEWIHKTAENFRRRYGGCSHCLDLASVTNNAFRLIGQDLYLAALAEPERLQALFDVILETMRSMYRMMVEVFGPQDPVPLANCNMHLLGPATYEKLVLPYDIKQNYFAHELSGVPPRTAVHHCDVKSDPFLTAYAKLPGLAVLQASFLSDIPAVQAALPGTEFSALVSPVLLNSDATQVCERLESVIAQDIANLAIWNIDAATTPEKLTQVFATIQKAAYSQGREAQFMDMPLCWEEMEWAHGRYRGHTEATVTNAGVLS
jgi:hypothetical protein